MKANKIIIMVFFFNLFIVNLSYAKFNKFMIGIYTTDFDNNSYSPIPIGTDPLVGTDFQYLKMLKDENFNLVFILQQLYYLNGYSNPQYVMNSPSKSFLDRCSQLNLKVILNCPEIYNSNYNYDNCVSALNYYGNHPALWGFSIRDEPSTNYFESIKNYTTAIRTNNPNLVPFVNLFPNIALNDYLFKNGNQNMVTYEDFSENYIQNYINTTNPSLLCFDHYTINYNYGSGTDTRYFQDLHVFSTKSVNNNIPFYSVIETHKTPRYCGSNVSVLSNNEFNYIIYAPLSYGAKGLLYWIRDHYSASCSFNSWDNTMSLATKTFLSDLHHKIIENSDIIMSLKLRNVYHYSTQSTIDTSLTELIQDEELWDNFSTDSIANSIFNMSNPFTISGGSLNNIMISFLTNTSGQKFFWIFNKNISSTLDLNINFKTATNIYEVLNSQVYLNNQAKLIHLEPGEAKLFEVIDCNSDLSEFCSQIFTGNNPDIVSDLIHLGGVSCNVIFENSSKVNLVSNQTIIRENSHMLNGCKISIKTVSFIDNSSGQYAPKFTDNTLRYDDIKNSIKIYPNPANNIINLSMTSDDIENLDIYNTFGYKILSINSIKKKNISIDVSNIPNGAYLIKVNSLNGIYIKEILVK